MTLPELPIRIATAGIRAAAGRFGSITWVILAVIVGGGVIWYCNQPPERREKITKVASQIGTQLLTEFDMATDGVQQARLQLRACVVPRPEQRSTLSAILRELAMSPESLSVEQLAELHALPARPSAAELRAF